MNIAIVGFGKMGKTIERLALERGHSIAAIVDPLARSSGACAEGSLSRSPLERNITGKGALSSADIALEFTGPGTALANIIALAELKIPVVAGTTGWYEKLDEARAAVEKGSSSLLWASNYSLGIHLLYRIAAHAASLLDKFPEYDLAGYEVHHSQKADSPSGTAKTLAEKLLQHFTRKKTVVWDSINRKPEPSELHFPSLRIGSVPGTHGLVFDSPDDSIEIIHRARNRDSLASGALKGAEWLFQKKQSGVFTIEDFLADIVQQERSTR
jgi:4-hydroxy-tetrahydrodipicolinate reductase